MTSPSRPQLLVTVLDWGMGHATRTWPLIEHALGAGWRVHIASKGTALAWLAGGRDGPTPPHVPHKARAGHPTPSGATFGASRSRCPAFVAYVERERKWAQDIVQTLHLDAILSDNCYGCAVPHPLRVDVASTANPTPKPHEAQLRSVVQRWAQAFDEVWVPDLPRAKRR